SRRRRHTRFSRDWSSDVCSSDLLREIEAALEAYRAMPAEGPRVWLDIEVGSQDYLNDLQRRIQAMTEELPVEVLLLRRARAGQQIGRASCRERGSATGVVYAGEE